MKTKNPPRSSNQWDRIAILLLLFITFLFQSTSASNTQQKVRQPFCWNEFEDSASRAFVSPVVVKAFCTVIYSRGSLPQFNASFHVSKIFKSTPAITKILESNPKIQLNFGMLDVWTKNPASLNDIQEIEQLRGKSCLVTKTELQKEYILFLQLHTPLEESENEIMEKGETESSWSVFAAPEVVVEGTSAVVQKALRRAKRPTVAPIKSLQIQEGSGMTLRCLTRGFPHPKVTWLKDGKNLDHQKKRIHIKSRSRHLHRLRIKNTVAADSGQYKCVAINVIGQVEAAAIVKVNPVPNTTPVLENTTQMEHNWAFETVQCPERGFCLNGGTCSYYPRVNARSCNCSTGFDGPRCEFGTFPTTETTLYKIDRTAFELFVYLTTVFLITLVILILFFLWRIHRRVSRFSLSTSQETSLNPNYGNQFPGDIQWAEQRAVDGDRRVRHTSGSLRVSFQVPENASTKKQTLRLSSNCPDLNTEMHLNGHLSAACREPISAPAQKPTSWGPPLTTASSSRTSEPKAPSTQKYNRFETFPKADEAQDCCQDVEDELTKSKLLPF